MGDTGVSEHDVETSELLDAGIDGLPQEVEVANITCAEKDTTSGRFDESDRLIEVRWICQG